MSEEASQGEIPLFASHVKHGLSSSPKKLSSKYFYDDRGSRIFQEIMEIPEYYLTNAEKQILRTESHGILDALAFQRKFNVIELGAGDGAKTKYLLEAFMARNVEFDYVPIDISQQAILDLEENLQASLPTLSLKPVVGDYFKVLEDLVHVQQPNLLLFLGSNIGNFEKPAAEEMLCRLQNILLAGDHLLIGFDLKKNPNLIRSAYFDAGGVTKSFNLNLLQRINRELEANFVIDAFDFYSYYDPTSGEVRSFIVSLADQEVFIGKLGETYSFSKNETLATELSKKYSLEEIDDLAQVSGFEIQQNFLDEHGYFTDSLWKNIK